MKTCHDRGFTLIELIIVIAILSVLVGTAVPYMQDSLVDSRRNALKQNLGNFRKVLNDFRGDNRRGPFQVKVASGAIDLLVNYQDNSASGSELVSGPIQYINSKFSRRTNVRYIPILPRLEDPQTAGTLQAVATAPTCYFFDNNPNNSKFDINTEFAFVDANGDGSYNLADGDQQLFNTVTSVAGPGAVALDYTDVTVTSSEGPY